LRAISIGVRNATAVALSVSLSCVGQPTVAPVATDRRAISSDSSRDFVVNYLISAADCVTSVQKELTRSIQDGRFIRSLVISAMGAGYERSSAKLSSLQVLTG